VTKASKLTRKVSFPHPVQNYRLSEALYSLIADGSSGLNDGEVTVTPNGLEAMLITDTTIITIEGDCDSLTIRIDPTMTPLPPKRRHARHARKQLTQATNRLSTLIATTLWGVAHTPLPN